MEKHQDVSYISFAFPGLENIRCAFQTRPGGVSSGPFGGGNIAFNTGDDPASVTANRASLRRVLGLTAVAELEQIHGDRLIFEPEPIPPEAAPSVQGDGLAASRRGIALLVRTADCQPLLLAHKNGGHIAALHVGWRGNRCSFPISGVRWFCQRYGLDPADVLAVRGPSLSPAKAEFINFDREWGPSFRRWFEPESRTMDLWGLTKAQLLEAGLPERQIYSLDLCTAENSELFFSYRTKKTCGRQANLIWITHQP
ncbi:MAG: polyphenol oxidase family protein [Desulfovibrio sp.]|jgi:YfiH family protein|nr:polyphenol oxidase family protein [Desulfovibrio sp.]